MKEHTRIKAKMTQTQKGLLVMLTDGKTYQMLRTADPGDRRRFTRTGNELVKKGLVEWTGHGFKITELGQKAAPKDVIFRAMLRRTMLAECTAS